MRGEAMSVTTKREIKWIPHGSETEPKYLVNYTSEENGKKIILGGKIRFGNLLGTNDPRDYNICSKDNTFEEPSSKYYPKYYENWEPFAKYHLFAYYLSHDGKTDDYEEAVKNILLWAHYGKSQSGMCFVYNTEKLKKICSSIFHRSVIRPIHYNSTDSNFVIPIEIQEADNHNQAMAKYIFNEFQNNHFHFFHKHEDWKYENEIRILAYHENNTENEQIFVDIEDCIEAVILGDKFDSTDCELYKIKTILKKKVIKLQQVKYKTKKDVKNTNELFKLVDITLD